MPTAASPSDESVRPVGLFADPLTLGESGCGAGTDPGRERQGGAPVPDRRFASCRRHRWRLEATSQLDTPTSPDRFNSTELLFGEELG